ncbi:murein peptide amidase A [bacterium]|nr:murein peptide amidase A [bacterium]
MFKDHQSHEYRTYGPTSGGRPIEMLQVTRGPVNLLLIGGVHGDEYEGFFLVEEFLRTEKYKALDGKANLWVIPRLNPDGCEAKTRTNGNGVDLNRNMPTKDWDPVARKERYQPGPSAGSEIETKEIIKIVEDLKPRAIFTMHSWNPMINYNGPCQKLAEAMAAVNKYVIDDDIGYPTPGSFGTWAGWERKIPTITLEIQRDSTHETIWKEHAEGLLAGLMFAAENETLG